jgi:hypothetical protein
MEKKKTESLASQLPAVNRSLEKLSTQTDYNEVSLEEAASSIRESSEIQNKGAILKHGFRRRLGILIGEVEEKDGVKARKKIAADLMIPFTDLKKAVNEAAVPADDYNRYVETSLKRNKEITDAGAIRAGKETKKPKLLSSAQKILMRLGVWKDSKDILGLSRYEGLVGSKEDLDAAATLLEILSSQFAAAAKAIKERK